MADSGVFGNIKDMMRFGRSREGTSEDPKVQERLKAYARRERRRFPSKHEHPFFSEETLRRLENWKAGRFEREEGSVPEPAVQDGVSSVREKKVPAGPPRDPVAEEGKLLAGKLVLLKHPGLDPRSSEFQRLVEKELAVRHYGEPLDRAVERELARQGLKEALDREVSGEATKTSYLGDRKGGKRGKGGPSTVEGEVASSEDRVVEKEPVSSEEREFTFDSEKFKAQLLKLREKPAGKEYSDFKKELQKVLELHIGCILCEKRVAGEYEHTIIFPSSCETTEGQLKWLWREKAPILARNVVDPEKPHGANSFRLYEALKAGGLPPKEAMQIVVHAATNVAKRDTPNLFAITLDSGGWTGDPTDRIFSAVQTAAEKGDTISANSVLDKLRRLLSKHSREEVNLTNVVLNREMADERLEKLGIRIDDLAAAG